MSTSPITFIHSADWQLGRRRKYLSHEAQSRYIGDRVNTIRSIGDLAANVGATFMVVAGDVFESPDLTERDIGRAFEAMAEAKLPIYLLPGNHDPLGPGSIWERPETARHIPDNVTVLDGLGPFTPTPGVEIVAAPWMTNKPAKDPVTPLLDDLQPTSDTRILVGHGMLNTLDPDSSSPVTVNYGKLKEAIESGLVQYVALGDRHICHIDDATQAINYSGTHESTTHREPTRGTVLSVTIDAGDVQATRHEIGTWLHTTIKRDISTLEDVDLLREDFTAISDRARVIVRTALTGTMSMSTAAALDNLLEEQSAIFASVTTWERHTDLAVIPDDADQDTLGLTGFAADALAELSESAKTGDPIANEALKLLYRLGVTQ